MLYNLVNKRSLYKILLYVGAALLGGGEGGTRELGVFGSGVLWVKRSTNHTHTHTDQQVTHTHTDREQHPRHRYTHTRQEQHPTSPNEHPPQTLNNARRWRDDRLTRYGRTLARREEGVGAGVGTELLGGGEGGTRELCVFSSGILQVKYILYIDRFPV